MKLACLCIALILSSLTLGAQDRKDPSAGNFSAPAQIKSFSCPVDLRAKQRGTSELVEVRHGQRTQSPGQRIALTLRTAPSLQIISSRVKVYGLAPKGRVLQSTARNGLAADISRTLTVEFDKESNGDATGELVLNGFTSVTSLEVEEIVYKDGMVWSSGAHGACRVAPDTFMLISDR